MQPSNFDPAPPAQNAYVVGPPEQAQQTLELGKIISQCFTVDLENWSAYVNRLGASNVRIIGHQDRVVGGLGLYPMGQWFGGQSVPMTGIAAVGIAPDYRGQGAAATLLRQTLGELSEQGVPLAALYASTSHLYRRVGFEQAGSLCGYSLPLKQVIQSNRILPLTPVDPQDQSLFAGLYRQQAQLSNGMLDRNDAIWQALLDTKEQPLYAYVLGTRTAPEGYVVFTQQSTRDSGYNLKICDRICLTHAASQRFWTLMSDHRSLADRLFWYGSTVDPMLSMLEEQIYRVEHLERWLLRILNVEQALARRGYPHGVEADLHLDVEDPLFSTNHGCFTLQIAGGSGQVTRGGRGDLKLGIRSLAPLYSGFLSASQLQQMGWVSGEEAVIAIANTIFAGVAPWMTDHF